MAVADLSTALGFFHHTIVVTKQPAYRTHTHGSTIAAGVLRKRIGRFYPVTEHVSIATLGVGIATAPRQQTVTIAFSAQHGIGYSNGTNGIIGIATVSGEKFKVFLRTTAKLKARPDNVAYYGT